MTEVTRKQVANAYSTVFHAGYCELCPLDEIFPKVGENAGRWEAFEITPEIAVVSGSLGTFGTDLPDTAKNILRNARKYRREHRASWEQERRYLTRAARRFANVLKNEQ